eukprot:CFRG0667T1
MFFVKVVAAFVAFAVVLFFTLIRPVTTNADDSSYAIDIEYTSEKLYLKGNSSTFMNEFQVLGKNEFADGGNEPMAELKRGSVTLPSGRSLNFVGSVCASRSELAYVFDTQDEADHMKNCCFGTKGTKYCTAVDMSLCQSMQSKLQAYATKSGKKINFWTRDYVQAKGLMILPGLTLWAHTVTENEQIGHLINKDLLFFNLRNDYKHMPRIDWFVFPKMAKPAGPHALQFTETVLGDMFERTYWGDEIRDNTDIFPNGWVCFERGVEGEMLHDESVFDSEEQGDKFRKFAVAKLGAKKFTDKCPPLDAVVLRRTEGTGLRRVLNYDVIDRVFKRNGINSYRNVTVSGADDTLAHVKVFSNFGLMVSSHSSQLKNLIFSPKNSIVIETKGTELGYLDPSPFQHGVDQPLGIIYKVSNGHIPNYSSCPEDHGCKKLKKYKVDYWLDEDIFEKDLQEVLAIRHKRCDDDSTQHS